VSEGHVLVVEDDEAAREFIATLLRSAGYRVHTAAHGVEALEAVRGERPCVVILDLSMPLLDGASFARILRDTPELAAIPIICVTGTASERDALRRTAGVAFLPKPLEPSDLLRLVEQYCGPDSGDPRRL
jgi:two-component system OmpR family response regulator